MAVGYTTYFNLPKGDDAIRNWGAIWNGIADKVDLELCKARNLMTKNGQVLVKNGEVLYKKTSGQ